MTGARRAQPVDDSSLGVDIGASLNLVGELTKYLGLASLVPIVVAIVEREAVLPFVLSGLVISALSFVLRKTTGTSEEVGIREGYLVVSLVWLVAAVFGALPYVLGGGSQLSSPVDAMFEGMSGFTTTGVTTVVDVEALPTSMLVWRQLTVWLGGIGVVALSLAVLPRLRVGGRQLVESELSVAEERTLSGRIRDAVARFWRLYLVLSAASFVLFAVPGWLGADDVMSTFEAFAHSLTAIATGGLSTEPRSMADYGAITQWSVVVVMALGGVNFLLLFRTIFLRRVGDAVRDEELRLYGAILAAFSILVALLLVVDGAGAGVEETIRHATFQVVSVVTTTGYASEDYSQWPSSVLMTLALLLFVGGCAGSTSSGIKIFRHLVLARLLGREIERTVHPELVRPVRMQGVIVDQQTLLAVISFVLLYIAVFVLGAGVIAVDEARRDGDGVDFAVLDIVVAAATALGNAGVGFGPAGPSGSFEGFGDVSTVTMTVLMWVGRLEIIPVIVLLRRSYWRA